MTTLENEMKIIKQQEENQKVDIIILKIMKENGVNVVSDEKLVLLRFLFKKCCTFVSMANGDLDVFSSKSVVGFMVSCIDSDKKISTILIIETAHRLGTISSAYSAGPDCWDNFNFSEGKWDYRSEK